MGWYRDIYVFVVFEKIISQEEFMNRILNVSADIKKEVEKSTNCMFDEWCGFGNLRLENNPNLHFDENIITKYEGYKLLFTTNMKYGGISEVKYLVELVKRIFEDEYKYICGDMNARDITEEIIIVEKNMDEFVMTPCEVSGKLNNSMINVLTIGFDKYASDDVTFIRLEDETESNIRNYTFCCVIIMGESSHALNMYKNLFKSASDFLLKLPLHIIDTNSDIGFDMSKFDNYPWPEGFGYGTYNISKDLVDEEMNVIALRDGSIFFLRKTSLTSNTKEWLEARVELSKVNLKLAIKEHELNLAKLDKEINKSVDQKY